MNEKDRGKKCAKRSEHRGGHTVCVRARGGGFSVKERRRKLKKVLAAPRVLAARHTRREAEVNPHQRSSRRLKIPAHAIFMTVSSTGKVTAHEIARLDRANLVPVMSCTTKRNMLYIMYFHPFIFLFFARRCTIFSRARASTPDCCSNQYA